MKPRALPFLLASLALFFCYAPNAFGLADQMDAVPCGAGGTFFTNISPESINFDLSVTTPSQYCAFTLSWTDASNHPQTITLTFVSLPVIPSQGVSSSLPAGGVISWQTGSTAYPGTPLTITWELERPPVTLQIRPSGGRVNAGSATFGSVGGGNGDGLPCGFGATLYTNLTPTPIKFDLSLSTPPISGNCAVTLSWTDASGQPQTLTVGNGLSQGIFFTSLPAGGAVSWSSSGSSGQPYFRWELERAVTAVSVGAEPL